MEYLKRIKDSLSVNAYISIEEQLAVKSAKEIDKKIEKGIDVGLLSAVPYGVKDNIITKGIKTTCSSKMLSNFIPEYNSFVCDAMQKNGGVMLGKTNMDEFGMGNTSVTSYYGKILNPLNYRCSAGGSSGGSAAAVAGDLAVFTLGSDTGGSIRLPASFCGVIGFKPSYGKVSRNGLIAYASSLDTIGVLAKNVSDTAAIYNIISVCDNNDFTFAYKEIPKEQLRVGLISDNKEVIECGKIFEEMGAEIKQINLDEVLSYCEKVYYIIACSEAASNLARYDGMNYGYRGVGKTREEIIENTRCEGFGAEVKKRIIFGNYLLSEKRELILKGQALRNKITSRFKDIFKDVDVLVMPTVGVGAPEYENLGEKYNLSYDNYTVIANIIGAPAINIPIISDERGMPIGVSLMSEKYTDLFLLNVSKAVEEKIRGEK